MACQGQPPHLAARPDQARVLAPEGTSVPAVTQEGVGAEGLLLGLADVFPVRLPAAKGAWCACLASVYMHHYHQQQQLRHCLSEPEFRVTGNDPVLTFFLLLPCRSW